MLGVLDAIMGLAGYVVPPLFDLIKRKFIPLGNEDVTLSTLATTKPDVLPTYIEAYASLVAAKTKHFNRDVIDIPSKWVVDLRASIIPICVAISIPTLCVIIFFHLNPPSSVMHLLDVLIGSWFGNMVVQD